MGVGSSVVWGEVGDRYCGDVIELTGMVWGGTMEWHEVTILEEWGEVTDVTPILESCRT